MLIDHVEKGARCTVACMPVPIKEATAFGVMAVDESDKIIDFVEKPANPPQCTVTPANRWPVWAFTFLTPITCMNCWRQTIKMTLPATISVKTLSPKSPAKVWLTRILSALLRAVRSTSRTVLARCRYAGSLLEGEPGFSLGDAGAGYV